MAQDHSALSKSRRCDWCRKMVIYATHTRSHIYCSADCRKAAHKNVERFGDFAGTPKNDEEEAEWTREIWRRAAELRAVSEAASKILLTPEGPGDERAFRAYLDGLKRSNRARQERPEDRED